MGSITEVVQTVKHPHSHAHAHARTMSHDGTVKNEEVEKFHLDYLLPKSAELDNISTPGRQIPQVDSRNISRSGSRQEAGKKSRKSARISLMG